MRRKLGDRRARPRYDIVGDLWGTLEVALPMPLKNVGRGGALFESHVALPAESLQRITFDIDGQPTTTQVRIRHVQPQPVGPGDMRYLIGVEFVGVSPALAGHIERLLAATTGEQAGAEA